MATIEDFGGSGDSLTAVPLGGATGWAAAVRDAIAALEAGSGIPASLIDAKGDLIAGSAADTAARLAVGADYSFLQALASESTGVKWGGALTSYTPTITGFTQGNGTVTGSYLRVGNLCAMTAKFTFGSTSAAATDACMFSLPVTGANPIAVYGRVQDADSFAWLPAVRWSTTVAVVLRQTTNGQMTTFSTTLPFTWTTGDYIEVGVLYEVA